MGAHYVSVMGCPRTPRVPIYKLNSSGMASLRLHRMAQTTGDSRVSFVLPGSPSYVCLYRRPGLLTHCQGSRCSVGYIVEIARLRLDKRTEARLPAVGTVSPHVLITASYTYPDKSIRTSPVLLAAVISISAYSLLKWDRKLGNVTDNVSRRRK